MGSQSEHGRASLGNELSRPRLACPGPVPDPQLMELELVTKVTWKRELGLRVGNEMTRGARGGLVTLVMGCLEARGGSRAGPGLERKSDPRPFGDLPSVRLVLMGST